MTQLQTPIAAEANFEETLLRELIAADLLSEESADRARRAHERTNNSMVDILARLGLCADRPGKKRKAGTKIVGTFVGIGRANS
jgi:hypothetical protein